MGWYSYDGAAGGKAGDLWPDVPGDAHSRRDVVGDQLAAGQIVRRARQVRVVAGDVDAR